MGYARLAIYLVGLLVVVGAAWVLLTQTELGEVVPGGVALAVILLLVGIGVMASAKSINDARSTRTVTYDGGAPPAGTTRHVHEETLVPERHERVVEERRYE